MFENIFLHFILFFIKLARRQVCFFYESLSIGFYISPAGNTLLKIPYQISDIKLLKHKDYGYTENQSAQR